MEFGLPQSSIVRPLGFSLYVLPVGHIIKSFGLQYYMYADDVQLYTSFNPNDHVSITSALNNLSSCIVALKIWMQNNMLKLNDDKTESFIAVPPHLRRNVLPVSLNVGDKSISPSDLVRNLGVIYSQMSVSGHVNSLCFSLTYQLRNISRIHRFLDYYTSLVILLHVPLSSQGSTMAMGCFLVLISAIFKDFRVSRAGLRSWCVNHINGIMLHHVCVNSIGWLLIRE